MAETYDVDRHIQTVAEVAGGLQKTLTALARVTIGNHEISPGWAVHHRRVADVKQILGLFCEIDLGLAVPKDPAMRESSMHFLARAAAALEDSSHEEYGRFVEIYGEFDTATAPLYTEYALAFGSQLSQDEITGANIAIDQMVGLTHEPLKTHPYQDVLPTAADLLAQNRHSILSPSFP